MRELDRLRCLLVLLCACLSLLALFIPLLFLESDPYTHDPSIDDFHGEGGQNFSFLSFARRESVSWADVLATYAAWHADVMVTRPTNARYLISAPKWYNVGLANNIEAMTLSLFAAIITDRAIIFHLPLEFSSVLLTDGLLKYSIGATPLTPTALQGAYRTLQYLDLDYEELSTHFKRARTGRRFRSAADILLDVPPDACGFPFADIYASAPYSQLLARLGDWRRPFSKFLFQFRPIVSRKIDMWMAEHSVHHPMIALQLRFMGIFETPPKWHQHASKCVVGLLEQSRRTTAPFTNATIVVITDAIDSYTRNQVLTDVNTAMNKQAKKLVTAPRDFRVVLSPAQPTHVNDDQGNGVAWLWAAFDLALLSRASLGVITPASSYGYTGLYLGDAPAFMLDPDVSRRQCDVGSSYYLTNPMSANRAPWYNPSFDRLLYCSMHDAYFVRRHAVIKAGLCDAVRCPLCSCASFQIATTNSIDNRFPKAH